RLLAKRALLLLFGLLISVLMAEGALRLVHFGFRSFAIPDDQVGYVLKPNAEGWFTTEGQSYVKINSQGLRDREHTLEKPANTLRVAILGDPFAEAMQL